MTTLGRLSNEKEFANMVLRSDGQGSANGTQRAAENRGPPEWKFGG